MRLDEAIELLKHQGFICESKYEIRTVEQIKNWLLNNTDISDELIEVTQQPAVFISGVLSHGVIMIKFEGRFITFSYTKGMNWKEISMNKRTLEGLEKGWNTTVKSLNI